MAAATLPAARRLGGGPNEEHKFFHKLENFECLLECLVVVVVFTQYLGLRFACSLSYTVVYR